MTVKIEDNVPPPAADAEKPKRPRSRARKQAAGGSGKKTANPAASLIAALKFLSVAQKKAGPTNVQFSHLTQNWAAASDGILTVATKIDEDLQACPHTLQFIDALAKASDEVSITQLNENALAVSSGVFRALVPCVGFDEVPIIGPDPQCAVIDDRIKLAFAAVAPLATEGAPNATFAAVLLQANSAVATNGHALLEYWHGIDLPPGLLLPKASAQAIAKCAKPLVGFGFDQTKWSSATFYFDDGSWIKTQLFGERYPAFEQVLNIEGLNPWPVPPEFFAAVRAVESFSENGNVYFEDGAIASTSYSEQATTYKVEGLPERMGFNAKYLLMVEEAFKSAHFGNNKVIFFGENMRGAIMGLDMGTEVRQNVEAREPSHIDGRGFDDMDDDIPF